MRKSFALLPAVSQLVLLGQPVAAGPGGHVVSPENHMEFLSGGAFASMVGPDTGAPAVSPKIAQERATPFVGPNVRVNAPQQPAPNGFLGRGETTVAPTGA